jgi:hypothetical protein
MCTIIAKRFPNIGWVGVKNRDRPAATRTTLFRDEEDGYQRVTLVDESTQWTEGMNGNGVSIISSSLSPAKNGVAKMHPSKDGLMIRDALAQPTVDRAVALLRDRGVGGCVMVFDADKMILIEGKTGSNRRQIVREITGDKIARTNHGVWIPSAGYQPDSNDPILAMRRISSQSRLEIANYILDQANTPEELMPLLAKRWIDNPQLTTLRTPIPGLSSRTTEQLMLDPKQRLMLLRNVDGVFDFNQRNANPPGSQVLVGIVHP